MSSNPIPFIIDGKTIPCEYDSDCPYSSICYTIDKINPLVGQCGCDAEYGDIGDKCNEFGDQTYYRLVASSIIMTCSFILAILVIYDILLVHKRTGIKKLDVKITTSIACICSASFLIAYCASTIFMALHPTDITENSSPFAQKKRSLAAIRSIFLVAFIFFFVAAALNVSILWLEVAITTKRFKFITNPQLSKKYRYAVGIFDVTLAAIILILNWVNGSASNAGIVGVIAIIVLYSYSAYSITATMRFASNRSSAIKSELKPKSESHGAKKIRETLEQIRSCAVRVIGFLLLWLICIIVTAAKFSSMRKSVIPQGQILDFSVMVDLGYLAGLCGLGSLALYLHKPRKVEKGSTPSNDAPNYADSSNGAVVPTFSANEIHTHVETNENVPPSEN